MAMKSTVFAFSLLLAAAASAQPASKGQELPKFMDREVTVTTSFPTGLASVCIEGPPQRQCFTAPKDFGGNPTVELIQVARDKPARLFSAANPKGGSGWQIHFALLRPGAGKILENLLLSDATVSNLSQYALLNDPSVSPSPIFLTADFVWGPA